MLRLVIQAVVRGLPNWLRGSRRDGMAHRELEHAHWDAPARRWVRHEPAED